MDSSRREFMRLFGFASFAAILASCRDAVLAPPTETTSAPQPAVAATSTSVPGYANNNYSNNGNQNQNQSQTQNQNQNNNNHNGNNNQSGATAPTQTPYQQPNPTATPTPATASSNGGATVTMQDIRMEGISYYDKSPLGENGSLSASMVKANKAVTLNYIQDSHGHKFNLTPDHFLQLRQGKTIEVISTIVLDHQHIIRINPARVDASSAKVTMPIYM